MGETQQEIRRNVAALDDEQLQREIAFAELADDPHPNAAMWLAALREEKTHRQED